MLAAFYALAVSGAGVRLSWCPNPEPDIAGYNVYIGAGIPGAYTNHVFTTNTTHAFTGLESNVTYRFAVTAVSQAGLESEFSREVWGTIPKGPETYETLLATNVFEMTNVVTLRGRVDQLAGPFGAFFEIVQSTNMCGTLNSIIPDQLVRADGTNLTITASTPLGKGTYTVQLVVTNALQFMIAEPVTFTTTAMVPIRLRIQVALQESQAADGTNWVERHLDEVAMPWPTNGTAFFRSKMGHAIDYEERFVISAFPSTNDVKSYETNKAIVVPSSVPMPPGL